MEGSPKYQYSEFVKTNKRDGQLVVRSNDFEEFKKLLKDLTGLAKAIRSVDSADGDVLVEHAKKATETTYATTPAGTAPKCPQCGSDMWDNRAKKTNAKAPDFKCKADNSHVIWPPKETPKTAGQAYQTYKAKAEQIKEELDTEKIADEVSDGLDDIFGK